MGNAVYNLIAQELSANEFPGTDIGYCSVPMRPLLFSSLKASLRCVQICALS